MSTGNAAAKIPRFDDRLVKALNLVQAFQAGVVETLRVQCSCEVKPLPFFIKETETEISADVAGVIGMTSSEFIGALALTFPKAVYLQIMGGMFGEKYETITDDIQDGAGELLNIIFGYAKTQLNANGFNIERAIPTVMQGETFEFRSLTPIPAVVMPFQTECGTFHLEMGIAE